MIFNVGAGGATDAGKIKYGDSNVGATLDNLNESVDELNESLGNYLSYNEETDYFGFYHNGEWINILYAELNVYAIYDTRKGLTEQNYSVIGGNTVSVSTNGLQITGTTGRGISICFGNNLSEFVGKGKKLVFSMKASTSASGTATYNTIRSCSKVDAEDSIDKLPYPHDITTDYAEFEVNLDSVISKERPYLCMAVATIGTGNVTFEYIKIK